MNLHVVAYPTLAQADYDRIQSVRKLHNGLYPIIEPHFTIVFSVPDMDAAAFIAEIKEQSQGIAAIPFCIRCAVICKDSFSNNYDAFLVPDEGHSAVVKLHDRLYSGKLSRHHRLDVSYIPHLSIAYSPDVQHIKKIVDHWNKTEAPISGVIGTLEIINYENRVITTIERVEMEGAKIAK